MKRLLALVGLVALVVVGLAAGFLAGDVAAGDKPTLTGPNGEHKVVVCKYVGTPGVNERLQTGNNPVTPDASALPGFTGTFPWEFADAQGRSIAIRWAADSHDGDISECPVPQGPTEVTPTAPTFQDPTCEVGAAVHLPTVTGVTYAVEGTVAAGEKVTVVATADDGYVLVGAHEWEHTFGPVPDNCVPPPPPPPPATEVTPGVTFRDPTCDVGAAVVPTTTTGLTYTIEGKVAPGERVTVTASANDGYTIRGNNRWEHTFGLVPSNCATTPPPTDVCPNIDGIQEAVPDGLVLDAQGNCVEERTTTETAPTAPLTPPTTEKKTTGKAPAQTKPAPVKPPKQAVAGAYAESPPKLAHTP